MLVGSDQLTVMLALPAAAAAAVGALGTAAGVATTTDEAVEVPLALPAFTSQLMATPLVRPLNTSEVAEGGAVMAGEVGMTPPVPQ